MNSLYKFLQRLSRFLLKLISTDYKKNHKFQNKNQVTNTELILSLLKEKITPNFKFSIQIQTRSNFSLPFLSGR